jgi:hypothetical protein
MPPNARKGEGANQCLSAAKHCRQLLGRCLSNGADKNATSKTSAIAQHSSMQEKPLIRLEGKPYNKLFMWAKHWGPNLLQHLNACWVHSEVEGLGGFHEMVSDCRAEPNSHLLRQGVEEPAELFGVTQQQHAYLHTPGCLL